MELPTIVFDKAELIPGSSSWSSTRNQVVEALEEFGSFRAIYSVISREQDSCFFDSLRDLFDLPKETKRRFTSEKVFEGYFGDHPNFPLYEVMAMGDALNPHKLDQLANLMWPPTGNPAFRECYRFHTTKLADLNRMIRKMVFEAYGVDTYFEEHDKAINTVVRLIKYGAPMLNNAKRPGASPHYDSDFITVLHENEVPGLEVKAKFDDHWITGINCSDSSFLVIAGESLLGWSNGRIHSCRHRVMTSGHKSRYSIGLFVSAKGLIEAPSELVDEQHPRLFKPFDRTGVVNVIKSIMTMGGSAADLSLPVITTHFAL